MHNFKLQNIKFKHLIVEITIDLWFSTNFANINDVRSKCNSSNDKFVKIHIG